MKSARRQKSTRQVGSWTGRARRCSGDCRALRTRRLPREDPHAEVGEKVRVGVGVGARVGPVEFSYNVIPLTTLCLKKRYHPATNDNFNNIVWFQ